VLWQVIGVLGVFVLLIALTLVRDEALLAQFAGVVR